MEPVPTFDLYAELEVSRTATTPTIDAAWRSLLKRHHPDVGGPRAAERTVRLNVAHDWLTNPVLRARYDVARKEARRERAEASAARERSRPPAATEPETAPPRQAASRPVAPRWATSPPSGPRRSSMPPGVARSRRPLAHRTDRDRWRVLMVAVAALAIVVALGTLVSVTGLGAASPGAVASPSATAGSTLAAIAPAESSTLPSTIPGTPGSTPQASARGATAAPASPVISLSGGGNHPRTRLRLAGGTYLVDYVVSSPPGGTCPWAVYLTDSAGLDLLMASAYPVDETVRHAERDSGIVAGPAAVRVESECPHWSASITRLGP